jgi:hypothetical protein
MTGWISKNFRNLGNSPTHERDLTTMFSVFRLATWFFFLNGFLISAIGGVFWMLSETSYSERGVSGFFQVLGFSEILTLVIFLSMSAFLTIFVPIRVVGPIMGPRVGRYFDQIVLSGISPPRYFAGKILAQNVFLLLITAAAVPYFTLAVSLGGISVKYTLLGIVVLAVYTNLLAVCTLFFSIFVSDLASILLTLVLFTGLFLVGFFPACPHPLPFSTSAIFVAPVYDAISATAGSDSSGWARSNIFATVETWGALGIQGTQVAAFLIGATCLSAIAIAYIVIGPLHSIVQENSTFGEVVMPGDAKRRSFLKRRPALRLRSEISFFYENRPPWLRRWDFLLRWLIAEVIFLVCIIAPLGAIQFLVSVTQDDEEMLAWVFLVGLVWVIVNNLLFLKDRACERLSYKGMETGQIDLMFYVSNLVVIAGAVGIALTQTRFALDEMWLMHNQGANFSAGFVATPSPGVQNWLPAIQQPMGRSIPQWHLPKGVTAATIVVIGFSLHFFLRWLSTHLWSKWTTLALGVILFVGVTLMLPLLPNIVVSETEWAERYGLMSTLAAVATYLSLQAPIAHAFEESFLNTWLELGDVGIRFCLVFHLNVGLAFLLVYLRARKKLTVRELV